MTIPEKITEIINNYVIANGTETVMNRSQLYMLVNSAYPMNQNSFLPADYCYNRINESISFEKQPHLFEYSGNDKYRLLGENFEYSGPVYCRKKGETEDSICGHWNSGIYIPEGRKSFSQKRAQNLTEGLKRTLQLFPVTLVQKDNMVTIRADRLDICQAEVIPEAYKLSTPMIEWQNNTTYLSETDGGDCCYYVDSLDECLCEVKRLVAWAARQGNKNPPVQKATANIIKDYGNDVPAFRLNVDDWFDEKIKEGRIALKINKRGDMRQRAITPGLYKIMKELGVSDQKMLGDRVIFYEAEIRTENGKGTAIFRMAARQRPDTAEKVRNYYRDVLIPGFGKVYREDCEWYRLPLTSMNLNGAITGKDIYQLLEAGLKKGEEFEKKLCAGET